MARLESKEKDIYQIISIVVASEIKDKAITGVTITGCKLTKDMSFATVYYTVMGKDEKKQKVETALKRARGFIKKRIADEVPLRKIPELLFEYDHSLEAGNRIEMLLRNIKDE